MIQTNTAPAHFTNNMLARATHRASRAAMGLARAELYTSRPTATLPRKVNLAAAFLKIKEPWSPHVAGDINECQLKLAKMQGEFVWHQHELEDECFLIVRGKMRMKFRAGDVRSCP